MNDLFSASQDNALSQLARVHGSFHALLRHALDRTDYMQGTFQVPPAHKADGAVRRVLDDVLTSGATVDTLARTLLCAVAKHMDVLFFARVVAPARTPI